MTQPFLSSTPTIQHTELLAALSQLFSRAKIFYQHSAETAGPGNLRRQFAALAELHQRILYLFPTPAENCKAGCNFAALSELDCWYSNKPTSPPLLLIQQQLTKQLQLQKTIIRNCDLRQHHMTLLHFTASMQIAADQLAQHS